MVKKQKNNSKIVKNPYVNYSKKIDSDINNTIKNVDKIEKEILKLQKNLRLIL